MIKEFLNEKALEEYTNEDFKLEIYKSKGMNNPGLKFKGSQRALLSAFAKLVETALTDEVIPAKIMHDIVLYIANDLGKLPEDIEVED